MPMKSLFCWSKYDSDDEKSRENPTPKNLLVAFMIFIMSPFLLLKSQLLRVKRGNLILPASCCADNTLKIIDFGISAHFEVEQRPGFTMGHGELSGWNPIRRWRFHPQRRGDHQQNQLWTSTIKNRGGEDWHAQHGPWQSHRCPKSYWLVNVKMSWKQFFTTKFGNRWSWHASPIFTRSLHIFTSFLCSHPINQGTYRKSSNKRVHILTWMFPIFSIKSIEPKSIFGLGQTGWVLQYYKKGYISRTS